jgi:hypothetical protein
MHHFLTGTQVKLTYLQDRRALAGIDWPTVFDDLMDAGVPLNRWRWCDLEALTHVILATERQTGRHIGVLGLSERTTAREPWLLVENVMVRPADSQGPLPRAMLAHALVRVVCLDGKPIAIAASRTNRDALCGLRQSIRSAALYPPAEDNIVSLDAAKLGRQIGAGHTVLDLRPVSEASLLRDLRGLHGIGPGRLRSLAALRSTMAKPARSGGATRRPRKATPTGRTG